MAKNKNIGNQDRKIVFPDPSPETIAELNRANQENEERYKNSLDYIQELMCDYAAVAGQIYELNHKLTKIWEELLGRGVPFDLIEKRKNGQHVQLMYKDGVLVDAKEQ